MAMNITSFRTANLKDVAALVQLVNTAYHPESGFGSWTDESGFFFGTRTSEQSLKNMLVADDSVVLLGLHEDVIVACVHLEKSKSHAHIGMLAVNPARQRAGIGKQMLAQAEAYASSHFNVEKFVLIVISLRVELIDFYLRRDYYKTDRTIDYAQLCGDICDAKIDGLKFAVLEKRARKL
jgi:ribosomal protein S18 acetylase RimI-like enzyme